MLDTALHLLDLFFEKSPIFIVAVLSLLVAGLALVLAIIVIRAAKIQK